MGTLQRLGFYGVVFFMAASFLAAGCDTGGQNRRTAPTPPPAPPPPPPPPAPTPPPVVEWKPDPKLQGELDDYRDIGDYQIRIPKVCLPQPVDSLPLEVASFTNAKVWAGDRRGDGTRLQIAMVTCTMPKNNPDFAATAEGEIDFIVKGVVKKAGMTEVRKTPVESGTVAGIPFVRTFLKGSVSGQTIEIVNYLTKNGGTFVWLMAGDAEPHSQKSLNAATASILTFRKK
jgi:hypothetical protein